MSDAETTQLLPIAITHGYESHSVFHFWVAIGQFSGRSIKDRVMNQTAQTLDVGSMQMHDHSSGVVLRTVIIGLTAFLTVVDLFATQAILPSLTRAYGVSPAAMGFAVNSSTIGMAGVAGRQRTPVANMMLKLLRSADWSRYAN
jgi:hypothetical protein